MVSPIFLLSYLCLWILVILSIAVIFYLAKQMALMSSRLGPMGAPQLYSTGLQFGSFIPEHVIVNPVGRTPSQTPSLLIFVSAGCSKCLDVAPTILLFAKKELHHVRTFVVSTKSDNDSSLARAYAADSLTFITDPQFAGQCNVEITPYAILVDPDKKVAAKGLVNDMAQLESLLNFYESRIEGAASAAEMDHV